MLRSSYLGSNGGRISTGHILSLFPLLFLLFLVELLLLLGLDVVEEVGQEKDGGAKHVHCQSQICKEGFIVDKGAQFLDRGVEDGFVLDCSVGR